jgi:hypothetical protein
MTERPVTTVGKVDPSKVVDEQSKRDFAARAIQVLDRGLVNARLDVQGLPDDIHGEWAANDPESIFRYKSMGFEIDTKYAVGNALHSDATGKAQIGDVVFMVIPKWKKQILDGAKQELIDRVHNKKRDLREETEFNAFGLEKVNESSITKVGARDINAAIDAAIANSNTE